MPKNLRLDARIDAELRQKIQELSGTLGLNQSAVIHLAINRLHQQEIKTMTAQIDPTTIDAILRAEVTPDFASYKDKALRAQYIVDRRGTFRGTNLVLSEMNACPNTPAIYEWHDGSVTVFDIRPRTQEEAKSMTTTFELDTNTENEPVTDMQTYATRKDAKSAIANMQGWDAKPVKFCFATVGGGTVDAWVIECDGNKYLREDGFVR